MVTISTRLGPKGQVLVPKLFREEYGLVPGDAVTMHDTVDGVLIAKKSKNVVAIFEEISKKPAMRQKGDVVHGVYEQYEERWRRSRKRT